MLNIKYHPTISSEIFNDLYYHFSAIDTILSLHFSNHASPPSLSQALTKAASLARKRVTATSLLSILEISPQMYTIINNSNQDFSLTLPDDIDARKFNHLIPLRKDQFLKNLNQWIMENRGSPTIPYKDIMDVAILKKTPNRVSHGKVMKKTPPTATLSSPTKRARLIEDLKNDSSMYKFKPKNSLKRESEDSGLSLIERIRLKEKLNKDKDPQDTPELKYQRYIQGKLVAIYNIVYEMNGGNKINKSGTAVTAKSFPMPKLVTQIQDSLQYPISEDEVRDVIQSISNRLSTKKMEVLTRGNVSALKVFHLDRDFDISLLEN